MAKIYFNNPIIKHLKEVTILNFFSEENGKTIFLRDTRTDIYRNQKFVYGDLDYYQSNGDYYVDIKPQKTLSSEILGVYIGEGYDFEIISTTSPVFVVRQKSTKMALGMIPDMYQGREINETTLGMFHLGTEISFKFDGIPIKDKLTKEGWIRISGPADNKFGIITVEDAFAKKEKSKNTIKDSSDDAVRAVIERIEKAKKEGEINPVLADELILSKTTASEDHMFMFLADDIKKLKDKNIL